MVDIKSDIAKADIAQMPSELFGGRIIVVHSVGDVEKAVNYLRGYPILGIDTETRPSFAKGKTYGVALLQISTEDTCFLFRLNYIGMPRRWSTSCRMTANSRWASRSETTYST